MKFAFSGAVLAALLLPAGAAAQQYRIWVNADPIQQTEAQYSDEALRAELEGTVRFSGAIAPDGSARDLKAAASLGLGLDEKAAYLLSQWRFPPPASEASVSLTVDVSFTLASKRSRWHLIGVSFGAPEGASRPILSTARYPVGAGIGPEAIEEGRLLGAMGRQAWATVSFDVDERGIPVHLAVENAAPPMWGAEAIAVVRDWRFIPGVKDGKPVSVPCVLHLLWGATVLSASSITRYANVINPDPPSHAPAPAGADLRSSVVIMLNVAENSAAENMRVVKSLRPDLDEQAVNAVARWHFQPGVVNGRPVRAMATVTVEFQIPGMPPPAEPRPAR